MTVHFMHTTNSKTFYKSKVFIISSGTDSCTIVHCSKRVLDHQIVELYFVSYNNTRG
jgi:hypothetical protein